MFHDIRENDASIYWLTNEILQVLRAHYDSPRFKAKQVKAQTSRKLARGGFYWGHATEDGKYHPSLI